MINPGISLNFSQIFQDIVNFAGTFNTWLILAIYLMLVIGEFSIALPYLLEAIWILAGYNVTAGLITPPELIALMLVALCGRATGAAVFYSLVRYGSTGVLKFYHRFFKHTPEGRVSAGYTGGRLGRFFRRINVLSPLSVGLARLFYLRVPFTIALGVRKRLDVLMLGVLINSLIWDSIYILIGVIGGSAQISQLRILLYSLGGVTAIYAFVFLIRRLSRARFFHRKTS